MKSNKTLRFSATITLVFCIVISSTLTVRFMMLQGATSEVDTAINITAGMILAIAEVLFSAIIVYLVHIDKYFLSVLFLIVNIPLICTSILASNLQLLNSQSKTENYAMANNDSYQTLVGMQRNYMNQIKEIKRHPYYNERNPRNKKYLDEQISLIMNKLEAVNNRVTNFQPNNLESGNGFQIIAEWFGVSTNTFKQYTFFSMSVLIEAIMLLCTVFLTETSVGHDAPLSGKPPSNKPRKGFFKRLFSSIKLPNIFSQPSSHSSVTKALNIQKNISATGGNIPEYSEDKYKEYSTKNNDNLSFNVSNDGLVANLKDFPHIVIAGVTNSGKSNFLKNIVLQLIAKNTPEELKIIAADLKDGSTFFRFKSIPHLEKPITTSASEALAYLAWLEAETSRRQKILVASDCEKYDEYIMEKKVAPFPYLLAIFEEVSTLSGYEKSVQGRLQELTSKSRSAGISIILSTQFPKAKILDSSITTNCSGKFCFKVGSVSQSLVVLGEKGAEKLKGGGHGIFGNGLSIDFQAPLVEKEDELKILKFATEKYEKNTSKSNIIQFPTNIQEVTRNIPEYSSDKNIPTTELIELVFRLYSEGKKQTEIGSILGITQGNVSKLLKKAQKNKEQRFKKIQNL